MHRSKRLFYILPDLTFHDPMYVTFTNNVPLLMILSLILSLSQDERYLGSFEQEYGITRLYAVRNESQGSGLCRNQASVTHHPAYGQVEPGCACFKTRVRIVSLVGTSRGRSVGCVRRRLAAKYFGEIVTSRTVRTLRCVVRMSLYCSEVDSTSAG